MIFPLYVYGAERRSLPHEIPDDLVLALVTKLLTTNAWTQFPGTIDEFCMKWRKKALAQARIVPPVLALTRDVLDPLHYNDLRKMAKEAGLVFGESPNREQLVAALLHADATL